MHIDASADQILRTELDNAPGRLFAKPIWVEGAESAISEEPLMRLPQQTYVVGMGVKIDGIQYEVVAIELDRVFVRPRP